MNIEQEREAFEAWCDREYRDSAYRHKSATCGEWEAWQARALAPAPAGEPPQPVAWMEAPHGAIRANLAYKLTAPQSISWSIPLYAAPTQLATRDAQIDCLQQIADMDPSGQRADDLGRAARLARGAIIRAHLAQPVQAQRAEPADAGVQEDRRKVQDGKGTDEA